MATTQSTPENGTGDEFEPTAPGPINTIGVDDAGATHYHAPYGDRVWVVDVDGTLEREQRLGGRSVHDWIRHVDNARGWQRCHYYEGGEAFRKLIARLVDDLEEGA